MVNNNSLEIISRKEVADEIHASERTVDRYRTRKVNPLPYIRLSQRRIAFQRKDILAWLESNRVGEVA